MPNKGPSFRKIFSSACAARRKKIYAESDVIKIENTMEKCFWVYILADQPFGTLYLGVTSNLARRTCEHKEGLLEGFSKQYGIKNLVCYEEYPTALEAIAREKKLKKWKRNWKLDLVKKFNPDWKDLYEILNQ